MSHSHQIRLSKTKTEENLALALVRAEKGEPLQKAIDNALRAAVDGLDPSCDSELAHRERMAAVMRVAGIFVVGMERQTSEQRNITQNTIMDVAGAGNFEALYLKVAVDRILAGAVVAKVNQAQAAARQREPALRNGHSALSRRDAARQSLMNIMVGGKPLLKPART